MHSARASDVSRQCSARESGGCTSARLICGDVAGTGTPPPAWPGPHAEARGCHRPRGGAGRLLWSSFAQRPPLESRTGTRSSANRTQEKQRGPSRRGSGGGSCQARKVGPEETWGDGHKGSPGSSAPGRCWDQMRWHLRSPSEASWDKEVFQLGLFSW